MGCGKTLSNLSTVLLEGTHSDAANSFPVLVLLRAALKEFTAKQLRIMMCLQPWGGGMTYGAQSRVAMIAREKELKEFFLDLDVAQRDIEAAVAAGATVPSDAEVRVELRV